MTMILVMFKVAVFALCVGVAVSVIILLPVFLYTIPYDLWIGFQNNKGKQMDKKKEGVFRSAKNSTKLYKAWILRKEPTI